MSFNDQGSAPLPAHALTALVRSPLLQAEKMDLFALLRHIEASARSTRLGRSQTPREDVVRLGQYPSTIFAPSTIYGVDTTRQDGRPRVRILSFGVFGPNGAFPIHLTEYVRERLRNQGDRAPADFVDLFHHRFISLFYRAWADAQSVVQLDIPGRDRFSFYTGALIGMGFDGSWDRDSVEDSAKLHAASHLVRLTRNAEGLSKLLSHYFQTPAHLSEFVTGWILMDEAEQTRLGGVDHNNRLGQSAVAGKRIPDVQGRFRITLGAMRLAAYERMLPGFHHNMQLRDWVRNYVGIEMDWDVDLVLSADAVPRSTLGGSTRLGWTTWLGTRSSTDDAHDLRLNPERDCRRTRQATIA